MFLTRTAELVEQTQLLCKVVEAHDDLWWEDEALLNHLIHRVNDKVESLRKGAVSAVALEKGQMSTSPSVAGIQAKSDLLSRHHRKNRLSWTAGKSHPLDVKVPGIHFFEKTFRENVQKAVTFLSPDTGICVDIPEIDLIIRPCFSGPFELPAHYESASPAYLIQPSRKVTLNIPATLLIHHYTSLASEEDCDEMKFFSANPIPEYRNNSPVYTFKHITESKGKFMINSQIGEIQLRHFCLIKIGRRRTRRQQRSTMYSARLYRSVTHESKRASAVFCMCLNHPLYIKCCNQRIPKGYTAMSNKEEAMSVVTAQITGDEVLLSATSPEGWSVTFDKEPTKMQKRDLDVPKVSEFTDYPPKFLIHIHQTSHQARSESPQLLVQGLDITDCSFKLVTPSDGTATSESLTSPGTSQHTETFTPGEQNRADATLSHHQVLTQLREINREWNFLGMALGLEHREIQEIELNHSGDVRKCLERVIEEWLKCKGKEVLWRTMYEALGDPLVDRPDIAKEINDKYFKHS